ncbi:MAG: tRNA uridine-5-carboxymethylaminomethyl(34) synthesis GTPase MnmE [Muribaculaceae bacterium]|nr:tRNA uridine-5-carboxymethylaminomethyl(34) synthesis GTPase MnmE [Muribaculaceae bacterium]
MESTTIAAVSTPPGVGGIAVIRLSGPRALEIADKVWKGKSLKNATSHTAHLGDIITPDDEVADQAVATIFHKGKSFTGEDTVEFSIHGSKWIQREVMALLIDAGAAPAAPGEFTKRAFINGRIDLAQAESIADTISAESRAAHRIATSAMKGELSRRLDGIRNDLITLASLLELELDFSEEDVEFADRNRLNELSDRTISDINRLRATFRKGKAIKDGIPTVIAGIPNAGKSTLLNALIEDEKAIVSDIPGTTRDTIEDTAEIGDVLFRFIDTAGLRDTEDTIEQIGVERAKTQLANASLVLWLIDPTTDIDPQLSLLQTLLPTLPAETTILPIITKKDLQPTPTANSKTIPSMIEISDGKNLMILPVIEISAKTGTGIDRLKATLTEIVTPEQSDTTIITNLRHYQALTATAEALHRIKEGLTTDLSPALIAQDLREAIHHLGTITGAITTDTLLQTIFSTFCIGK